MTEKEDAAIERFPEEEYAVWDAHYYDNPARMFPHDHECFGRFRARGIADLRNQLATAGHDPSNCRWELVSPANARIEPGRSE